MPFAIWWSAGVVVQWYLRNGLSDRHARREALIDLEEVITAYGQALEATESDFPGLPIRLGDLGNGLRTRYGRRGALADLEEATMHSRRRPI